MVASSACISTFSPIPLISLDVQNRYRPGTAPFNLVIKLSQTCSPSASMHSPKASITTYIAEHPSARDWGSCRYSILVETPGEIFLLHFEVKFCGWSRIWRRNRMTAFVFRFHFENEGPWLPFPCRSTARISHETPYPFITNGWLSWGWVEIYISCYKDLLSIGIYILVELQVLGSTSLALWFCSVLLALCRSSLWNIQYLFYMSGCRFRTRCLSGIDVQGRPSTGWDTS